MADNRQSCDVEADCMFLVNELSSQTKRVARAATAIGNIAESAEIRIEECKKHGFQPSYITGLVSDLSATMLQHETDICNALSSLDTCVNSIRSPSFPVSEADFSPIVDVKQSKDALIVRTPRIHKRWRNQISAGVAPFRSVVLPALQKSENLFKPHGKVDLYALSVYPKGTTSKFTADGDNLDTKSVVDAISTYLNLDDNGIAVTWHICAAITDELSEGTYTILTRKKAHSMSEKQLISLIKSL